MKKQEPNDQKIYHCGRRSGHPGQHSAGKYYKWTSTYTPDPERK